MSEKVGIKCDSILSWETGEEAPPPAEISRCWVRAGLRGEMMVQPGVSGRHMRGVFLAVSETKVSRSSWDADMDMEIGSRAGHLNCRHGIQSIH